MKDEEEEDRNLEKKVADLEKESNKNKNKKALSKEEVNLAKDPNNTALSEKVKALKE